MEDDQVPLCDAAYEACLAEIRALQALTDQLRMRDVKAIDWQRWQHLRRELDRLSPNRIEAVGRLTGLLLQQRRRATPER